VAQGALIALEVLMQNVPPTASDAPPPVGGPPAPGSPAAAAGPGDTAGDFLALLTAEVGMGTVLPLRPNLSPEPDAGPQTAAKGPTKGDMAPMSDAPAVPVADPATLGLLADLAALFLPQAVTTTQPAPPHVPPAASGASGTVAEASAQVSPSVIVPASDIAVPVAALGGTIASAGGEAVPPSASLLSGDVIAQPLPEGVAPSLALEPLLSALAEAGGAKAAPVPEGPAGARDHAAPELRRAARLAPTSSAAPATPSYAPSSERNAPAGIAPIQAETKTPVSAAAPSAGGHGAGGEEDRQDKEKPAAPKPGFALPAGATISAADIRPVPALPPPGSSAAAGNPVQQVAPVVIALAHAPQQGGRVTVTLQPEQLGRVEIHLHQQPDAGASVHLIAERPETLALLQRDAGQLDRALGQAGITVPQGGLSFALAGGDGGGGRSGGQRPGGRGRTGGDWLEGEGALGSLDAAPRRLVLSLLDIAV
jgi:flagellar hook-length control protein FliK